MNIKKCSKCGWEYPREWPGRTCRFCHTPLKGGLCVKCGEWFDDLNPKHGMCKKCWAKINLDWKKNRVAKSDAKYAEWLDSIAKIPTPYKTLTEDQWLDACKHFGGCAYCGAEQIDARAMFISFKRGGRYCSWNIIPACERCATMSKQIENPFDHMDVTVHRSKTNATKKYNYDLSKLQKIVDYLSEKMEEYL